MGQINGPEDFCDKCGRHGIRPLKRLLILDSLLRFAGIACFTIFVAAIYNLTGKASEIGIISLVTIGPALIVTAYAGKFTSLLSPLGVLKWTNASRVILFTLAVFFHTPIELLIEAAFQSLLYQIALSAKMSLDALIVDDKTRTDYLSQKTILGNLAIVAGPAAGGAMISLLGISLTMVIMSTASLVIVSMLYFFPAGFARPANSTENNITALESLRHLRSMPLTAAIVLVFCTVAVILEIEAPLLFPFVHEIYHAKSWFTGLLLGLGGLGGVIGSLAARKFPRLLKEKIVPWLVIFDGSLFFIFTQLRAPVPASILFIGLGVMGSVTLIMVEGAVQRDVQSHHQPFVFALMQLAGGAGGASLGLVAGFLTESFGAKAVLASAASSEVFIGIILIALVSRCAVIQNSRSLKVNIDAP